MCYIYAYICHNKTSERCLIQLKSTIMKTLNSKLKNEIEENLVNYYANSMSSYDFVENHISKFQEVNEDQENEICNILAESKRDWEAIECDEEGATSDQYIEMDKHIENTTLEIVDIF